MRFNGPQLGAWYAAGYVRTAAAEVGHHLRREAVARGVAMMTRTYRAYTATLLGHYLDIRGQQATSADVYASERYDTSQMLGEQVRTSGGAGLLYDSLRCRDGTSPWPTDRAMLSTLFKAIIFELKPQRPLGLLRFTSCRNDEQQSDRARQPSPIQMLPACNFSQM